MYQPLREGYHCSVWKFIISTGLKSFSPFPCLGLYKKLEMLKLRLWKRLSVLGKGKLEKVVFVRERKLAALYRLLKDTDLKE